eukprot:Hpha_TRINITY_DN8836_c0_g1::TRINITY_DN8836_c0_g1_i1::g.141350::m.141350
MPWDAMGKAGAGVTFPADALPSELGTNMGQILHTIQVMALQVRDLQAKVESALKAAKEEHPATLERLASLERAQAAIRNEISTLSAIGPQVSSDRISAMEKRLDELTSLSKQSASSQRTIPRARTSQSAPADGLPLSSANRDSQSPDDLTSSPARLGHHAVCSGGTLLPQQHQVPSQFGATPTLTHSGLDVGAKVFSDYGGNQQLSDDDDKKTLSVQDDDDDCEEEEIDIGEFFGGEQEESCSPFLPDGEFRTAMDLMYMAVAGVEAVRITLAISYGMDYKSPDPGWIWGFAAASLFQFINCATLFWTAQLDGWELVGDEAHEVGMIWTLYVRGWFWFDLIFSLPIDVIYHEITPDHFWWAAMFRLVHLGRVPSLFKRSSPLTGTPLWVKGIWFVYFYFVSVHFLACSWIRVSPETESLGDSIGSTEFQEVYVKAMYFVITTMTTVGYGDIYPTDLGSRVFVIGLMVFGVSLYAYFLGNVSAYLSNLDVYHQQVEEKKKALSALMAHFAVPLYIQKEAFCIYPSIIEQSVTLAQFNETVMDLPSFMQDRVYFFMKLHTVETVPLFQKQARDCQQLLAKYMRRVLLDPKEVIIKQGQFGAEMYIILRGVVEIYIKKPSATDPSKMVRHHIGLLKEGQWFGEIALLAETKRTASVRSLSACEVLCLEKSAFDELLNKPSCAGLKGLIENEANKRKQQTAAKQTGSDGAAKQTGSDGDKKEEPEEKKSWSFKNCFKRGPNKEAAHRVSDTTGEEEEDTESSEERPTPSPDGNESEPKSIPEATRPASNPLKSKKAAHKTAKKGE